MPGTLSMSKVHRTFVRALDASSTERIVLQDGNFYTPDGTRIPHNVLPEWLLEQIKDGIAPMGPQGKIVDFACPWCHQKFERDLSLVAHIEDGCPERQKGEKKDQVLDVSATSQADPLGGDEDPDPDETFNPEAEEEPPAKRSKGNKKK